MEDIQQFDESTPNYYEILQLAVHASADEIKNAYEKRPPKDYSDDIEEPTSGEKTQLIKAAYEVLSDSGRRKLYDAFLTKRERDSARAKRRRKPEAPEHQEKTQVREGQTPDLRQYGYVDGASSSDAKAASERGKRVCKRKEPKRRTNATQARKTDLRQRLGSASNSKAVSKREERLNKRNERKDQKGRTQMRKGQNTGILSRPRDTDNATSSNAIVVSERENRLRKREARKLEAKAQEQNSQGKELPYAKDASSSNAKKASERAVGLDEGKEHKLPKEQTQIQEDQNKGLPPCSEKAVDASSGSARTVSEKIEKLRKRKELRKKKKGRKDQNINLPTRPGYDDVASPSNAKAGSEKGERLRNRRERKCLKGKTPARKGQDTLCPGHANDASSSERKVTDDRAERLRRRNSPKEKIQAQAVPGRAESVPKEIKRNEGEEKQPWNKGTSKSTDGSRKRKEPSEDVATQPQKRPKVKPLPLPRYRSKNAPGSGGDDSQAAGGGSKDAASPSVLLNLSDDVSFNSNCNHFPSCPQTAAPNQTTFHTHQRQSSNQLGQDPGKNGSGGGDPECHSENNAKVTSRLSRSLSTSAKLGFPRLTPATGNGTAYNTNPPKPAQSERGVIGSANSAVEGPNDYSPTKGANMASHKRAGDSSAPCPEEKVCKDKFDESTPDYYQDLGISTIHGLPIIKYDSEGIKNSFDLLRHWLEGKFGATEREQKEQRLQKAYEVLGNPVRRAAYDAFLQEKINAPGQKDRRFWDYYFINNPPESSPQSQEDPSKGKYKSFDSEYNNAIAETDEHWNSNYTLPPKSPQKGIGPRRLRPYDHNHGSSRPRAGHSAFPYSTWGWRNLTGMSRFRNQRQVPNTDDANLSKPDLREGGVMPDANQSNTDVPQLGCPRSAPEPVGDEEMRPIPGGWVETSSLSKAGAIPPPKKAEAASVEGDSGDRIPGADSSLARQQALHNRSILPTQSSSDHERNPRPTSPDGVGKEINLEDSTDKTGLIPQIPSLKEVTRGEPAPATPIQSDSKEMDAKSHTTSRSGRYQTPPNGDSQSKLDKVPGYTPPSAGQNSGMEFPLFPSESVTRQGVNPGDCSPQSGSCRIEDKGLCTSIAAERTQEAAASPALYQEAVPLTPVTKAATPNKEPSTPISLEEVALPVRVETQASPSRVERASTLIPSEGAATLSTVNKDSSPIPQQKALTSSEQEVPTMRSKKKNTTKMSEKKKTRSKTNVSLLREANPLPTRASTYVPRTNDNNVVITWHGGNKFSTRTERVLELVHQGIRSIQDLDNDLEKERDFWRKSFFKIEGIYKEDVKRYKGLICASFFVNKLPEVRFLSRTRLERILGRPHARFLTTPVTDVDRPASMEVLLKVLAVSLARDYPKRLLTPKKKELQKAFKLGDFERFMGIPGGQVFDPFLDKL